MRRKDMRVGMIVAVVDARYESDPNNFYAPVRAEILALDVERWTQGDSFANMGRGTLRSDGVKVKYLGTPKAEYEVGKQKIETHRPARIMDWESAKNIYEARVARVARRAAIEQRWNEATAIVPKLHQALELRGIMSSSYYDYGTQLVVTKWSPEMIQRLVTFLEKR